ncbi:hypothetical protein ACHAW5_011324 [Stephanodiscus triporus]|uniref:Uncharacterized protein n=1 Tax=Stephanodiscus triporus TaxID=2934178 RepID=A0ABD3NK72_9STRA
MAAFIRISIAAIALACRALSFTPNILYHNNLLSSPRSSDTSLGLSLIKGESYGSEPFDENEGGVGLTKRCAVKVVGISSKEMGSDAQELVRYDKLQELDISVTKSLMEKANCQLLCRGTGKETYQDPGKSYRVEEKVIRLAPIEAVKDALSSMVSSSSAVTIGGEGGSVVINFLGGDELIIGEVLEACDLLVDGLELPTTKTKVKFNSISFSDIPSNVCHVTVIASGGKAGGLEGMDESVARGEVYIQDGKWFTVAEGDIITT